MPRRPIHASKAEEPITPAWLALTAWLEAGPGRTQKRLADVCGVVQQTIGSIVARRSRPGRDLADEIAAATHGEVMAEGWFTAEERNSRLEHLAAVAKAGDAFKHPAAHA